MATVLAHTAFRRLFCAQVTALLGTGLLTVALGLLAFDIAGDSAGAVLGTAMTIKMVAYVAVSPVTAALTARLPRKPLLVATDIVRAGVALCLPVVDQTWQIYVLIFVLQSASATFTPAFQAVIPSVLTDEDDYTRGLSLSRLAYDLESVVSPVLAAALLTVVSYNNLFLGTVAGFLGSALLVVRSRLPRVAQVPREPFLTRLTGGARLFLRVRQLRGLQGVNLTVAAVQAMVIVNTVVLVRGSMGRDDTALAVTLGVFGAGSMIVAVTVPWLLRRIADTTAMLCGAVGSLVVLALIAVVIPVAVDADAWWPLLFLWFLQGASTSLMLTPSSKIVQKNSTEATRPALFAAQFSLSHACFLVTYPVAGALGVAAGLPTTALVLVAVGAVGALWTALNWYAGQRVTV
ncbi:MFS transporter [Corynebacterium kalidii]|uniref:MFS transporter n=1 Tax=Corynebacterium kalidii TaxID=2931982 RepID=A0A9X1WKN7_9CORY|nr:MFS transporter [Corynebacterium kalidii]MCJ7858197.1 MFS transporter [Corynebacterium kalidii]